MSEINDLVGKEIYKNRRHVNIPKTLMKPIAHALNKYIWWPTTSVDEVEREFVDMTVDPKAKTFKDLGIEPVDIKGLLYEYLVSTLDRNEGGLMLIPCTERIPQLTILRSTAHD
jgi:NADH dehydrogenase (ubiquinone) 1 alpha subcomplex subunit 9